MSEKHPYGPCEFHPDREATHVKLFSERLGGVGHWLLCAECAELDHASLARGSRCVCGESTVKGVHRTDGPCYQDEKGSLGASDG